MDDSFMKQLEEKIEALNLDDLIKEEEDIIRIVISNSIKDSFMPMVRVAVLTSDGPRNAVFPIIFDDKEDKRDVFVTIGKLICKKYFGEGVPIYAIFVAESWIKTVDEKDVATAIRPSESEDKSEGITITLLDVKGNSRGIILPIDRTDDGEIVLGESSAVGTARSKLLEAFYLGYTMQLLKETLEKTLQ
jgi:hypothetical protein